MVIRATRLLVKAKPMPAGTAFRLGPASVRLTPLGVRQPAAQGLAAQAIWQAAELPNADADAWDLCHQLRTTGFGIAGGAEVEFAEPDLAQQWPVDSPDRLVGKAFAATAADSCAAPAAPDSRYPAPSPYDWRWQQDAHHSGLEAARSQISNPANRLTMAHLDTGYRKGHALLPQFLDFARQRSFVDGDPDPNDASDPGIGGFGNNPGHGTATLGILAGGLFNGTPFQAPSGVVGGAPFANVIPIRVANSVVLFTNSSVARGISYAIDNNVDVLSMSMGGLPSQLWADMVNQAYDEGVTLVMAAGNNLGPFKLRVPRFIVYPARFHRVLAACGVMSDGSAYADFGDPRKMGGSYGPDSKMDTAMAAYTPNGPWAKYACPALLDFDGAGTSSATPQIAAAAGCWLQKNRAAVLQYPEKWMRVEAVRRALSAQAQNVDREHFGRGTLRANLSMNEAPAPAASLRKTAADDVDVPFLGPLLGTIFGAAAASPQQRMLRLEAAQIISRSGELQNILANARIDPDRPAADIASGVRRQIMDAMAAHPAASRTLRNDFGAAITNEQPVVAVAGTPLAPLDAETPQYEKPVTRKLRVFAFDPVLGMRVDTESINETTLSVPWEADLKPGPVGEYIEVIDIDPASNAAYAPVDLNHPHVLAARGLDPSEGVPQFHQQMVYAVAMNTIGRFEQALGRTALWAPRNVPVADDADTYHSYYVQRLRIYPHALREANSYYSPPRTALLFGYFQANLANAGDNLPGGVVFCCLSHDVVAHETTHALLDGLHRHYQYQTNADVAAFHEAFADIVALFQHFTIPAALKHTIARSRGDLREDNLLAELAQQFGQASNGSKALRSALGKPPKQTDYVNATEAHERGAVLVAAIFDAFLQIYDARIADLKRLTTNGTGVLPAGEISGDLVNRLAREAALAAEHVLTTCIRALDYCPPVDLTFGEYLRALITADMDLEPEDQFNYRTAFIAGFRVRGIFPQGVRNLSEENLRWQPPKFKLAPDRMRQMMGALDLNWNLMCDRRQAYLSGEANGAALWNWLQTHLTAEEASAVEQDLGLYIRAGAHVPKEVPLKPDGTPKLQIPRCSTGAADQQPRQPTDRSGGGGHPTLRRHRSRYRRANHPPRRLYTADRPAGGTHTLRRSQARGQPEPHRR